MAGGVSVVLAHGAGPGVSLEAALGAEGVAALRELLARRLRSWVRATFADVAPREVDGGFGDALAALAGSPSDARGGAVVIAAPELAVWRGELGDAALEDLRAGCALSFGPVFDGGLYLLTVSAAALPSLAQARGDLDLDGRAAMAGIVQLAERAGFEVGMLRTERGLRTADDLQALRVDPTCDAELRAVLQ